MAFEIILSPESIEGMRRLTEYERARVRAVIEGQLRQHDPCFRLRLEAASKSLGEGRGIRLEDLEE
jgi:hypothetical protein